MRYFTIGHRLPRFLSVPLFGDRQRHGLIPDTDDDCWKQWQQTFVDFYDGTQKGILGRTVNEAGYRILSRVDLSGRRVLEVGPGDLPHMPQWRGTPAFYQLVDVSREMLDRSRAKLASRNVAHDCRLLEHDGAQRLPFADDSFDVAVSFYTFEHLYPFEDYLREQVRLLKPGGTLIGAIPCEGGLAWGLGRLITGRRWLKKHTNVDPDQIICWTHPNFAETVMRTMESMLVRRRLSLWPWGLPSIDMNLLVRFVYEKPPVQKRLGRAA